MDSTTLVYGLVFFQSLVFLALASMRTAYLRKIYNLLKPKKELPQMPPVEQPKWQMPKVRLEIEKPAAEQPKMSKEEIMQRMKEGRRLARLDKLREEVAMLEQQK